MPRVPGLHWPSILFMGISFLGLILGYWRVLSMFTALAGTSLGQAQTIISFTLEALNPQLTNIIENATLTLYYNGTGPVPSYDEKSPPPLPISPWDDKDRIEQSFYEELIAIANGTAYFDACTRCIASTQLMHFVAITQPVSTVTSLLIRICNSLPSSKNTIYATTCESEFSQVGNLGPYYAQLFSKMSSATGDMQTWCSYHYQVCDSPPPILIDESLYFSPKPKSAEIAPEPSGQTINVLHLSDWHLDPRYDIGSEGNCTERECCRPYSINSDLQTGRKDPSLPASRFGSFSCDTPADLALSSFSSMTNFFDMDDLAFTIFTGDIVSHDKDDSISRAYVAYEEEVTFKVFKTMLGDIPVYATLGNHDTLPIGFNSPHVMNPEVGNLSSNPMAWNYELLSSLWRKYAWLNESETDFAEIHYGAYAATTKQGLRLISINSDFWYEANVFNYWNVTNPDPSGILKWLSDELSACENRGQRAWIMAHVPSGYDEYGPLSNPTALFYSIVRRFSPATIAGVFFGHTHQDQFQIFYDYLPSSLLSDPQSGGTRLLRNTTAVDYNKPIQMAYIGPSITPFMYLNAGYRLYQVDAVTFSVIGMQTYIANMSNSLQWKLPEWQFEYDARLAYTNQEDTAWPDEAPLNATFWHQLTESMMFNETLAQLYHMFESKSSVAAEKRGLEIGIEEKVCHIRSASGALGLECGRVFGKPNAKEAGRKLLH